MKLDKATRRARNLANYFDAKADRLEGEAKNIAERARDEAVRIVNDIELDIEAETAPWTVFAVGVLIGALLVGLPWIFS